MAEVVKKPIKITETILRDAHQSLIATRMTTEQMLPIVDKLDKVGYYSVECWGGATFDASLRFLKEDPWERLRKFRDGFKNTKLQMLFRGQNILGYRPYADDVVEYFVQKSIANGIDIIRIFDCMNDLRNLQTAVKAANKEKGHAQVAMSYTLGEAYTLDYWVDLAKRIEDMGANSICIKDMAGLLLPYAATELVTALKEAVDIPIQLHSHYTSGVASMTYLKAVEAGVDVIDTAMSPFALGTSQPATEVMVETFKGTPYDTGFDQNLLAEIEKMNKNDNIHGVLLFRPLPKHLDQAVIENALDPAKDVDCMTDGSMTGVFTGKEVGFPPCTPQACMEILDHYGIDCTGKRAVVIGRSLVVGKPAAMMLIKKNATVTVCHTRTVDMPSVVKEADIVIVAAGRAGVVDDTYLRPGQIVIDVGINVNAEGKLCGDVDFEKAEPIVEAITPVPGGVGSVTTSVLVGHVVEAAKRKYL